MSKIIDFYSGKEINGLSIDKVLKMDNHTYDVNHCFIQIVFPSLEKSQFNHGSPILTPTDIDFMKGWATKRLLIEQLARFVRFLYYKHSIGTDINNDHTKLRITRVMKLLKLLDMKESNLFLYETCMSLFKPDFTTRNFWMSSL